MKAVKKFNSKRARPLLPKRSPRANKTAGGKALIIAGSRGMYGAAVLSATAAARMGAGYVTLKTDAKAFPSVRHPEFLIVDHKVKLEILNYSAIAIGPGLGQTASSKKAVIQFLKAKPARAVLDADALNLCARMKNLKLSPDWIITPHEGELSRLIGISANKIRSDRRAAIEQAQKKLGCTVLLKGHRTLIASKDKIFEIQSGNKALAKAGTGDVLTGLIVGLLAQGLNPTQAACLGAFIHGHAADRWIKKGNDYLSLLPTDLLTELPKAIAHLRK